MSTLTLSISSCFVKDKGTYFIVVQLDETEFPSHASVRQQKFRTDLQGYNSQYLRFHKNVFKFENLQLGNRLVVKFGLFRVNNGQTDATDMNSLLVSEVNVK